MPISRRDAADPPARLRAGDMSSSAAPRSARASSSLGPGEVSTASPETEGRPGLVAGSDPVGRCRLAMPGVGERERLGWKRSGPPGCADPVGGGWGGGAKGSATPAGPTPPGAAKGDCVPGVSGSAGSDAGPPGQPPPTADLGVDTRPAAGATRGAEPACGGAPRAAGDGDWPGGRAAATGRMTVTAPIDCRWRTRAWAWACSRLWPARRFLAEMALATVASGTPCLAESAAARRVSPAGLGSVAPTTNTSNKFPAMPSSISGIGPRGSRPTETDFGQAGWPLASDGTISKKEQRKLDQHSAPHRMEEC